MAFMAAATTVKWGSVAAARHSAPGCTLKTAACFSSSFTGLRRLRASGSLLQQEKDCVQVGIRAMGVDPRRTGSRRKKGGGSPRNDTESYMDDRRREPFLQVYMRRFIEEGLQALDDAETLVAKASNPYGLTIRIGEEANE